MPELQGFLKGHVHLWSSGNRVWHHLSLSMTVKEEQAAGTFFLLIPPDWGVRPKKAVLHSAATLCYKNGILVVLSVKCQPSKPSGFLRVDNERTTLLQKERLRRNSQWTCLCVRKGCVFVYSALWSGARSCYGVATRTGLLYMRQRFASKVIVHAVLLSSPPPSNRTHSHVFNINSIVWRGGVQKWGWDGEKGGGGQEGKGRKDGKKQSDGRQVEKRRGGLMEEWMEGWR